MGVSVLSSATLLACGLLVLGRPLSTRQFEETSPPTSLAPFNLPFPNLPFTTAYIPSVDPVGPSSINLITAGQSPGPAPINGNLGLFNNGGSGLAPQAIEAANPYGLGTISGTPPIQAPNPGTPPIQDSTGDPQGLSGYVGGGTEDAQSQTPPAIDYQLYPLSMPDNFDDDLEKLKAHHYSFIIYEIKPNLGNQLVADYGTIDVPTSDTDLAWLEFKGKDNVASPGISLYYIDVNTVVVRINTLWECLETSCTGNHCEWKPKPDCKKTVEKAINTLYESEMGRHIEKYFSTIAPVGKPQKKLDENPPRRNDDDHQLVIPP